jgi:prepilin-type N-terminal cleavage/methylation domain-containing protein
MKQTNRTKGGAGGFTMIEVLLAMIIIATSAVAVLMWQKTSWSQTSSTNRLMVAGQIVEKQIEQQRMIIAQNPVPNFQTFKTTFDNKDVVIVDNSVSPPVSVRWHAYDTLHDPNGHLITDVFKVNLTAWWTGAKPTDSLQVETRIAQNF